jgi:hypothetical protein
LKVAYGHRLARFTLRTKVVVLAGVADFFPDRKLNSGCQRGSQVFNTSKTPQQNIKEFD